MWDEVQSTKWRYLTIRDENVWGVYQQSDASDGIWWVHYAVSGILLSRYTCPLGGKVNCKSKQSCSKLITCIYPMVKPLWSWRIEMFQTNVAIIASQPKKRIWTSILCWVHSNNVTMIFHWPKVFCSSPTKVQRSETNQHSIALCELFKDVIRGQTSERYQAN